MLQNHNNYANTVAIIITFLFVCRPLLVTLTDSSLTSITFTASQLIIPKVNDIQEKLTVSIVCSNTSLSQVLGLTGKDVVQASLSKNEAKVANFDVGVLMSSSNFLTACTRFQYKE